MHWRRRLQVGHASSHISRRLHASHKLCRVTPLVQEIRRQIATEGPMGFDQWMELALYNPHHGFYSSGGQAGRRGKDFLTSPEVGPLFGAVLARAIDGSWNQLGQPDPFAVIEAGAGRGALAASVLRAKPACLDALRYVMVERSELLRTQQQETLKSVKTLLAGSTCKIESAGELPKKVSADQPAVPFGMVIANELLDNLPSRILELTSSGWEEVKIGESKEGFAETLESVSREEHKPATSLISDATDGTRIPLQEQASAWVRKACELVGRGRVIVFDYGATTAELVERDGWLRTYTKHGKGISPLACPGGQDITCDVAFDQLSAPASLQNQAEFLRDWGIQSLVAEGQKAWQHHSAEPTTAALIARSRPSEADALCDPDTFGSYKVAQWVI